MLDVDSVIAPLNAAIARHMARYNTPGLSLALTDREQTLGVITYGMADIGARKPVTPDTLFEIGSIGKAFTSIALLQLAKADQLDLHAPCKVYLPWFGVKNQGEPITVHHLLSHTAGLISGTDCPGDARNEVLSLRQTVAAPPGLRFHYSNVGYKALGVLLEDLLKQPYGEIIQARVLDPLDMAASEPVITHDTRRRLAVGYQSLYDDRPFHRSHPLVPATWLEINTADGSIASTPGDMAIFLRMLLNQGQSDVLTGESFALMTQPVTEAWGEHHYGYGLTISEIGGHRIIGHGGGMVGYLSIMMGDMDAGLGVIVMVNGPADTFGVANFVLECLRAAASGRPLPAVPPQVDPTHVEAAVMYDGTYGQDDGNIRLTARGAQLLFSWEGAQVPLEPRGPHRFYVSHPDFDRYLLQAQVEDGKVLALTHGPDWHPHERYTGPRDFSPPQAWKAFTGHYRSFNPWVPNFRVVIRQEALLLIWPSGEEEPLISLGEQSFRIGKEEASPERLLFEEVIDGRALRARYSGCPYYRTFTP